MGAYLSFGVFSRTFYKKEQIEYVKMTKVIRFHRHIVFKNIPILWELDRSLRNRIAIMIIKTECREEGVCCQSCQEDVNVHGCDVCMQRFEDGDQIYCEHHSQTDCIHWHEQCISWSILSFLLE